VRDVKWHDCRQPRRRYMTSVDENERALVICPAVSISIIPELQPYICTYNNKTQERHCGVHTGSRACRPLPVGDAGSGAFFMRLTCTFLRLMDARWICPRFARLGEKSGGEVCWVGDDVMAESHGLEIWRHGENRENSHLGTLRFLQKEQE